jgi:hypothetical protein
MPYVIASEGARGRLSGRNTPSPKKETNLNVKSLSPGRGLARTVLGGSRAIQKLRAAKLTGARHARIWPGFRVDGRQLGDWPETAFGEVVQHLAVKLDAGT